MKKVVLFSVFVLGNPSLQVKAQAGEQFLGQISFVSFDFAPKGWADCNGQLLPINQNQALFSLLGTYYGGDGKTTFTLPDMRGRAVIDDGQGNGLSSYDLGSKGGAESVTLNVSEMPSHSHTVNAVLLEGNSSAATASLPANTNAADKEYSTLAPDTAMRSGMLSTAGGSQAHENRPPFVTLKCIIATTGIYPSRP